MSCQATVSWALQFPCISRPPKSQADKILRDARHIQSNQQPHRDPALSPYLTNSQRGGSNNSIKMLFFTTPGYRGTSSHAVHQHSRVTRKGRRSSFRTLKISDIFIFQTIKHSESLYLNLERNSDRARSCSWREYLSIPGPGEPALGKNCSPSSKVHGYHLQMVQWSYWKIERALYQTTC